MINFNHLYYFHVAASEGSLAAAASKLGVKQPTVSEQLRALERSLKKRLFERGPGGMRLTASGQVALEHTTTMFRACDRLLQALDADDDDVPHSLRVGVSSGVSRTTSTDFLLPLFALDDCTPAISTGETVEMLRALRANELDLVLSESEPPEVTTSGLLQTVIARVPLVAIAPTAADPGPGWQHLGMIQYRPTSSYRWDVQTFLESNGLKPRVVGEADDPQLLLEAAVRGGYLAVVPRSVARDALASGRVRVLAQVQSGEAGIHAYYQDGTTKDLARRAIEALIGTTERADAP